jgi:hypothetical protein
MHSTFLQIMINQIKEKLPDVASHIVPQNTVIKSIKNDYCLRPAFNFRC